MFLNIFLFLPNLVSPSYGSNILAILPTPSYSHQIAYIPIWKELSLRGHNVTVITTDPLKEPKLVNLTEIDMKWTYKFMADFTKSAAQEFTMWNVHRIANKMFAPISEAQLSHKDVQSLIHDRGSYSFDIVLAEFLFPEFLAIAEIYNCPKIIFSTLDSTALIHNFMGNPISPVLNPDVGAFFYAPLTFLERVVSTLYTLDTMYYYNKLFVDKTQLVKQYFNISKSVHDLISDVDMMFVNVNPILQPIRALGPSTVTIGGNRPVIGTGTLPKDIADFLDSAEGGFIYFSLGSNVKSKDLGKDTLEAITETLRELPYRVLWKFEADHLPNKPEKVKLIKWAPQQQVLSHPNIKVFITQGGLQSMEEGIYEEVPFVVIPFFADQFQNARIMKAKGIAVIVNRIPSVNKEELREAVLEVVNNARYRISVRRLKQLALDMPMTGIEKAIWWIEYVIRNKGAKQLRNPAADLPFYQYYLIDVIIFLIFVIIILLCATYLLLTKLLYRFKIVHKVHSFKKMQ